MPGKGRPFPKGISGNPAGRVPIDKELRAIKQITKEEVINAYNKFMNMKTTDLEEYVKTKQGTSFEFCVARILAKAMAEGDPARLDYLLNRLIGKVADKIDHTITNNPFLQMTEEEKLAKAKEVVALLEEKK